MRISKKGRALLNEFRNFAVKGSVVDMAAGVIIGTAFSKIVSSLVDDVLMPCLSLIVGSINIKELSLTLRPAADGEGAVVLHWGAFVQSVIDFLLIAWCIFIALKILFRLKKAVEFDDADADADADAGAADGAQAADAAAAAENKAGTAAAETEAVSKNTNPPSAAGRQAQELPQAERETAEAGLPQKAAGGTVPDTGADAAAQRAAAASAVTAADASPLSSSSPASAREREIALLSEIRDLLKQRA